MKTIKSHILSHNLPILHSPNLTLFQSYGYSQITHNVNTRDSIGSKNCFGDIVQLGL